jgi:hypothetical protein
VSTAGWIGVDLDGTLARYDGWVSAVHIGAPIEDMVARVKRWLSEGKEVRIFTARVSHDGTTKRMHEALQARMAIERWSKEVFGLELPITNQKDYGMVELFDDRCVQVVANTGELVGYSTRGLA